MRLPRWVGLIVECLGKLVYKKIFFFLFTNLSLGNRVRRSAGPGQKLPTTALPLSLTRPITFAHEAAIRNQTHPLFPNLFSAVSAGDGNANPSVHQMCPSSLTVTRSQIWELKSNL